MKGEGETFSFTSCGKGGIAKLLPQLDREGAGLVFVISAPSGAGKTTLLRKVMDEMSGLRFSVSYTTRPPRPNEKEGKDYHFVSASVFEEMIETGRFLEWAEVLGNRYGTADVDIDALASKKEDLILDVDTQGARKVKEKIGGAVLVFIFPPSPQVLRERLMSRGQDPREVIEFRLANAIKDVKEAHWYDYLLVNDDIEETKAHLKSIIIAERCRKLKASILEQAMKQWEVAYGTHNG